MKLIIGLGNPGDKYSLTRHNTGFRALDVLAGQRDWQNAKRFKSLILDATIAGKRVLLAKPQTFMNRSGEAARLLRDFYKIANHDILLVYDDLDLLLSETRWRRSGGSGGHNGLASVLEALGTDQISRLKIGIAEKTAGKQDVPAEDYVLKPFSKDGENKLKSVLTEAKAIITDWIACER